MKLSHARLIIIATFVMMVLSACSGTQLTSKSVEQDKSVKPVSDILVIYVGSDENTRKYFENKFVAQFKSMGVDAVSSTEAISMPSNLQIEEDAIRRAVVHYESDAVLITHLTDLDRKEVHNRVNPAEFGFIGYYGRLYAYHHDPGYVGTSTTVHLESNLYRVETEKLMWSGETKTWNKETKGEIIEGVIKAVVADLKKNELIAPK